MLVEVAQALVNRADLCNPQEVSNSGEAATGEGWVGVWAWG